MPTPSSVAETVGQIVALRQVARAVEAPAERARLARVIRELRRRLGAGVSKRQAAMVLGVSVQALDRWIAGGRIPVVRRPGSSRELVDAEALLLLAAEVERVRAEGSSRPLAKALAGLAVRGPLPRRLRPNRSSRELRSDLESSTAADRLREAVELSRVAAAFAESRRT